MLDVATLARIVPVLRTRYSEARGEAAQKQARERLIDALRRCVDPASGALTPGIALRLVEEARGLDADVARRAAEAALASPGLHEAKRARLEQLVRSLDDGRWPEAPVAAAPAPVAPRPAPAPPRLSRRLRSRHPSRRSSRASPAPAPVAPRGPGRSRCTPAAGRRLLRHPRVSASRRLRPSPSSGARAADPGRRVAGRPARRRDHPGGARRRWARRLGGRGRAAHARPLPRDRGHRRRRGGGPRRKPA